MEQYIQDISLDDYINKILRMVLGFTETYVILEHYDKDIVELFVNGIVSHKILFYYLNNDNDISIQFYKMLTRCLRCTDKNILNINITLRCNSSDINIYDGFNINLITCPKITYINKLPKELFGEIAKHLHYRDTIKFHSTCRELYNHIDNNFWQRLITIFIPTFNKPLKNKYDMKHIFKNLIYYSNYPDVDNDFGYQDIIDPLMDNFSESYENNKLFLDYLVYEEYSGESCGSIDYLNFIEEGLIDIVNFFRNNMKPEIFDEQFFAFLITYTNDLKRYVRHPLSILNYIECLKIGTNIKGLNLLKNILHILTINYDDVLPMIRERLKVQYLVVFLDHPDNTTEDLIGITKLLHFFNNEIQDLLWERYHQLLTNKEIDDILDFLKTVIA